MADEGQPGQKKKNLARFPSLQKSWWCTPMVPDIQEAIGSLQVQGQAPEQKF
jgi:hypothetical protein